MQNALGIDLDSRFDQFRDDFRMAIKEKGSGLREYTQVETGYRGESGRPLSFVDAPEAREITDPAGETPIMGHTLSDRWIYPQEWEWGDLITKREVIESMSDPTSPIYRAAMKEMMRFEKFKVIMPAFFGDAKFGVRGQQTATFAATNFVDATLAGRRIDVQLGGGGSDTGMNTAKLRRILEIFYALEVLVDEMEEDQMIFCGLGPKQNSEILALSDATAATQLEKPMVVKGKVMSWLGINFVHSTRWPKSGANRLLPVWIKDGLVTGVWDDIDGFMQPNVNRKNNVHIYMKARVGCVRVDEKKVLQLPCKE